MKSKKITAWVALVAMLMTLMPSSLVFALKPDDNAAKAFFPTIITSSFGDITNDADGIIEGTDLDINEDKDYEYSSGLIPTQDVSAGIIDKSNPDNDMGFAFWKNEDEVLKHYRRRQFLNFGAKSNAENVLERSFRDEGTETKITKSAVEIAYMDANKEPLAIKEGTKFEMTKSTWDKAWIDLSTDIQRTNVNLNTFLKGVDSYGNPLMDLNTGVELDNTKLAVADLAATGDQISFMIYNVVDGEFSGYLRIKITDNSGKVTIQDYPFVADGQYPEIKIETSTQKNNVGEDVVSEHKNTFIASADFEQVQESVDEENRKISRRYAVVDESALKAALNWEDEDYMPEDIWAMNDVTVETLKVSDSIISSEIESVTYTLQHYPDSVVLSGGKAPYKSGEIENFADGNYNIVGTVDEKIVIPVSNEGLNILTIVATDKSGLVKTNRYYFYIDKTAPDANYELVKLEDQVLQLFSNADTVTKWQQGLDMTTSKDVVDAAQLIAGINAEDEDVYQYRLLARDYTIAEADIDLNTVDVDGVPHGYTATAPASTKLTYGKWLEWSLDSKFAVIDEEFDGLIQVRVQDKAGNWSTITDDEEESVIADNTDAEIEFEVSEDNTFSISDSKVTVADKKAEWTNKTQYLKVSITDDDLVNSIRSSGLLDADGVTADKYKASVKIKAWIEDGSETKEITLLGANANVIDDTKNNSVSGLGSSPKEVTLTADNIFYNDADKDIWFIAEYKGTGIAYIAYEVTDNAGNVVEYPVDADEKLTYNVALRVDKKNPYIIYKGYDLTEKTEIELKDGTAMPWGPNSQVLEVFVNDNHTTDVQSGFLTDDNKSAGSIEVQSDKEVHIYKTFEDAQTHLDEDKENDVRPLCTIAENSKKVIKTTELYDVNDDNKEVINLSNTFYVVYEGTGIAKINFYAMDEAGNVRNYPETDKYDAMLRVDKIAPEFKDVKLVEQVDDVDDVEKFELFALEGTPSENVTRKQLKLDFDVIDNIGTGTEAGLLQSGVNYKGEIPMIDGKEVAITDVKDNYLAIVSEFYDNRTEEFVDMLENGTTEEDPRIEYILLPVTESAMPKKATGASVIEYIEANWADAKWITTWNDDIVIDKEFQGAVALRTIDRVGNIVYSDVIQVVAESKSPLVKFVTTAPTGNAWETLNQYGWAKRDVYFEVKVKDQNEADADAGIAKVVLQSNVDGVMSLEGDAIGTVAKEVTVAGLKADTDGYISLGYVKATATSSLTVTVYDKAELYDESAVSDIAETGNKTVATYNVNIDKTAPEVEDEDISFTVTDNNIKLNIDVANLRDDESGIAPLWKTDAYNKHNGFMPLYSVSGDGEKNTTGQEMLGYYFNSYDDVMDYNTIESDQSVRTGYVHENEAFEANQWELPGVQYALIPKNGNVKDVPAWNFEETTGYTAENGYFESFGAEYKWHNYVPGETVAKADFDGYIVVRVVDKAGNITLLGTSSILDIEFDNIWKKETQFIQVKASEKNGTVSEVEYFGNNDLLFPDGVHRSLTEALSGEGAFIEVVNEGITNVVIKSKTDINTADPISLSPWEGEMNIGSLNKDWKYQFVDVKIDKHAPEFEFILKNDGENIIADPDQVIVDAVSGEVQIVVNHWIDPKSNIKRDEKGNPVLDAAGKVQEIEGMSHISSGVKSIEWCAVPEGSEQENWKEYGADADTVINLDTFKGTVKVRVTDNAGNVTEKSKFIRIDNATPIISISNDSTGKCSHDPVTVFVTVSESADFSDIKSVKYEVKHIEKDDEGKETEIVEVGELPLIGGTITVDWEGVTNVKVTATNKGGVSKTEETTVLIHYVDVTLPKIKGAVANNDEIQVLKSGEWVVGDGKLYIDYADAANYPVWYSLNGGNWTKTVVEKTPEGKECIIFKEGDGLKPGANTVRIQARSANCLCKSDVITYAINYDNGEKKPEISFIYDNAWKKSAFVTISAKRSESVCDIESISYHLVSKGQSTDETTDITGYLNGFGGTVTIPKDGKWYMNDVIITMESGVKYKVRISEDYKFTNTLDVLSGVGDQKDDTNVEIAKVDTIAPILEEGVIKLDPIKDNGIELFTYDTVTKNKTKLIIDSANITNSNKGTAPIQMFKYALLEKDFTEPNWKDIVYKTDKMDVVIEKAFEGSVLVKAIDDAGNETVWSNSLLAEGNAPEIEITAPYGWVTEDALVNVKVYDKGYASGVTAITYKLVDKKTKKAVLECSGGYSTTATDAPNPANFTTSGGQLLISDDGEYELTVAAEDRAGNVDSRTVEIKIDKTAPTYSGSVELSLFNVHTIDNWDDIHDGWTYNHPVDISGIADSLSGVKEIKIRATTESGVVDETTLSASQTGTSFSTDGKYELIITDNAGNIRNISFVINKDLKNVINVVGVDAFGKVNIAVTDGGEMLAFYGVEDESGAKEAKLYNGITDQLWDGKTGVKYIYGKNDAGKITNKLHVIVAPSNEYGISLTSLSATPNRYLNIDVEGENVTVKKVDEIFNPGINKNISVGSIVEIVEDGVYSITTKD